jgi:hypothetical protein
MLITKVYVILLKENNYSTISDIAERDVVDLSATSSKWKILMDYR